VTTVGCLCFVDLYYGLCYIAFNTVSYALCALYLEQRIPNLQEVSASNMAHIADLMIDPASMLASNKYSSRESSPHTTYERVSTPQKLANTILTVDRAKRRIEAS
jgi:hypothetical protein